MIQFIAKTIAPLPQLLFFTNRRFFAVFLSRSFVPTFSPFKNTRCTKMLVAEPSEEWRRLYLLSFFVSWIPFTLTTTSFFCVDASPEERVYSPLLFITKLRAAINFSDDKNLFKFDFTRAERGCLTNLGWNALVRIFSPIEF